MSDIKELRITSSLRANLDDREALQDSFQEILNDLGSIKQQWNDCIYPLLGSLPGGRVQRSRADRDNSIDPIDHGFDGSQVYLDSTSRPNELSGLLHNGTRPKTIKEVLLDTYHGLYSRIGRVEDLLDTVNADNAAYDDSELRSWLIKLAGETWDPDEIAIGETFGTGNFAGAPAKSTVSLASRILNMRHLIGVEAAALTLKDISSLFAGTNYISSDTDVVTALKTLDGEIAGIVAGDVNVSLQDAYEQSYAEGGGLIDQTLLEEPIQITGLAPFSKVLGLKGGISFGTNPGGGAYVDTVDITGSHTGNYPEGIFAFHLNLGGTAASEADQFRYFSVSGEYDSDSSSVTEAILTLGKPSDDDDKQYFQMLLGKETTADGGDPYLTIRAFDNEGADWTSIVSRPHMAISSFDGKLELLSNLKMTLNSDSDMLINASGGGIEIQGLGITMFSSEDSTFYTEGGTLKLGSKDETTHLFGSTGLSMGSDDNGVIIGMVDAATGFRIIEYETADEAGFTTAQNVMMVCSKYNEGFSNAAYADVDATVEGALVYSSGFHAQKWAPTIKDGTSYGFGEPYAYTLYRDNIIKAKSVISVETGTGTSAVSYEDVENPFNVWLGNETKTTWDATNATLDVVFIAELDDANYSVAVTIEDEFDLTYYITDKATTGFSIVLRQFNSSSAEFQTWQSSGVGPERTCKINFQVV